MNKLYATISTDLVSPDLEAKVDIDIQAEPVLSEVPDNLYSAIVSNIPEVSAEASAAESEARQFVYTITNRLYTQIVPEKPSILAEERIFVYVPKVTYNSPGIAKFIPSQFNVINGEVSLKPSYLSEVLASNLLTPEVILVVTELPTIGLANRIYLVPINGSSSAGYVWNNETQAWSSLGTIILDMANYYTKTEVQELINMTIDNMLGVSGTVQVSTAIPTSPMVKLWAYIKEE